MKAENVTSPGGGPCTGPRNTRRRRDGRHGTKSADADAEDAQEDGEAGDSDANPVESAEKTDNGKKGNNNRRMARNRGKNFRNKGGAKTAPQPFWHEVLTEDVKNSLNTKGIRHSTGTIDVAVGPARIKLGTRGYSSMVHADGILAEGSFTCDEAGLTKFEWKHALKHDKDWKKLEDIPSLLSQISLTDANVASVSAEETPEGLWGKELADPRSALEANGFEMRRVILTTKKRK